MVGDVRPAGAERFSKLGGVGGTVQESDEDAPAGGVGKGCSDSTKGVEVS